MSLFWWANLPAKIADHDSTVWMYNEQYYDSENLIYLLVLTLRAIFLNKNYSTVGSCNIFVWSSVFHTFVLLFTERLSPHGSTAGLAMVWWNSLWTDAWKTDSSLFFMITNCEIVCYRLLTYWINCNCMCLFVYWW